MRNCTNCQEPLTGTGMRSAKLCPHCWAVLLVNVESGVWTQNEAARLFGVNPATIFKRRVQVVAWQHDSSI